MHAHAPLSAQPRARARPLHRHNQHHLHLSVILLEHEVIYCSTLYSCQKYLSTFTRSLRFDNVNAMHNWTHFVFALFFRLVSSALFLSLSLSHTSIDSRLHSRFRLPNLCSLHALLPLCHSDIFSIREHSPLWSYTSRYNLFNSAEKMIGTTKKCTDQTRDGSVQIPCRWTRNPSCVEFYCR